MKNPNNKKITLFENKYNIQPDNIKKMKILDWDSLKQITWRNKAMNKTGEWYCYIIGVGKGYYGDSIDDFWIGFNKKNDKIDYHFSCWEGMGNLKFDSFYETEGVDRYDLEIQSKTVAWLTGLIDKGILAIGD